MAFANNLERCRAFYEECGAPLIKEKYGPLEQRIAVGMVGEGSDCFGYDDDISSDHDYGLGFCIWLTNEDMQRIGAQLQADYVRLVSECGEGFLDRHGEHAHFRGVQMFLSGRRGVFETGNFYERLLQAPLDDWQKQPEERLAVMVNGEVFRDDLAEFTQIRERLLSYYDDAVWRKRIAQELHEFSQYAQSNYPRMMARRDMVTADLCRAKGMESAMRLSWLLNRRYAPYYKWLRKGLSESERLSELLPVLDEIAVTGCQARAWDNVSYSAARINMNDRVAALFEQAAEMVLAEMNRMGLVIGTDPFLEQYCGALLRTTGRN